MCPFIFQMWIFISAILSLSLSVSAWSLGKSLQSPEMDDLVGNVVTIPVSSTEQWNASFSLVRRQAQELVRQLDTESSCMRQAARGLISDCKSIEVNKASALEYVKNAYAVRLAVCELETGDVSIPSECRNTSPPTQIVGDRIYDRESTSSFGPCIKALQAQPQFWTSYSNNRQNAVLLCQASRNEIERENVISLFSQLAENNQSLEKIFQSMLNFANEQISQKQAAAAKFESLLETALQSLKESVSGVAIDLRELQSDSLSSHATIVRSLTEIFDKTLNSVEAVDLAISHLQHNVSYAASSFIEQAETAMQYHNERLETSILLASQLEEKLDNTHVSQLLVQDRMQQMVIDVKDMALQHDTSAASITHRLQEATELLTVLEGSANRITVALEYLGNLMQLLANIKTRASKYCVTLMGLFIFTKIFIEIAPSIYTCSSLIFVVLLYHMSPESNVWVKHISDGIAQICVGLFILLIFLGKTLMWPRTICTHRKRTDIRLSNKELVRTGYTMMGAPELIFQYYDPLTEHYLDDPSNTS